jgi:30S ribosome assembly GTPase
MTDINCCIGCGLALQNKDETLPGYVVRLEQSYCQRCFRLRHYGETKLIQKDAIASELVFEEVRKIDGLIVMVSDIMDLETGIFGSINRHLPQREMILVLTKTDLLPITVGTQKIERSLKRKLKEENLFFKEVLLVGQHGKKGKDELIQALKEASSKQFIFVGYANTGKSTLINALLERDHVTISPYPNTTLRVQKIDTPFGIVIDTPGIQIGQGFVQEIPFACLEAYLWKKRIRVTHVQLKGEQAFILPYVGIVSLKVIETASVSYYFATPDLIHRTPVKKLSSYRDHHDIGLKHTQIHALYPLSEAFDVVFKQIGWFSFRGSIEWIRVETTQINNVLVRKALI